MSLSDYACSIDPSKTRRKPNGAPASTRGRNMLKRYPFAGSGCDFPESLMQRVSTNLRVTILAGALVLRHQNILGINLSMRLKMNLRFGKRVHEFSLSFIRYFFYRLVRTWTLEIQRCLICRYFLGMLIHHWTILQLFSGHGTWTLMEEVIVQCGISAPLIVYFTTLCILLNNQN